MSAWHSINVYISGNTTFIGNSARNGGGVSAESNTNVHISGNTTLLMCTSVGTPLSVVTQLMLMVEE